MAIRMDGDDEIPRMSMEAWRALAAQGKAPAGQVLRKQYLPEEIRQVDGQDRAIRFVISTGAVDRDRDTIAPSGWKFDAFKKNPIVLWAHDYFSLPIAKATEIQIENDRLVATAEFATADMNPLAESVLRMLQGGFLRAASVGFDPIKHVFNDTRGGMDFIEQELLEFSIVPVPANPEALMEAAAAGIDPRPIVAWAKAVLASADRKAVPGNVSSEKAPEGESWSAPSLGDFTDGSWDDLTAAERRHIAGHFAYARELPPATYGDLKLPHHRASDGAVVWRGVAAAMGALLGARGGVDIPTGEKRGVYNHLAAHYRAFDKEPPEFRSATMDDGEDVDDCPMGTQCPMQDKGAVALSTTAEATEKVLMVEAGDGELRYLVDPAMMKEAWAEVLAGCARSAIGALKGRVD